MNNCYSKTWFSSNNKRWLFNKKFNEFCPVSCCYLALKQIYQWSNNHDVSVYCGAPMAIMYRLIWPIFPSPIPLAPHRATPSVTILLATLVGTVLEPAQSAIEKEMSSWKLPGLCWLNCHSVKIGRCASLWVGFITTLSRIYYHLHLRSQIRAFSVICYDFHVSRARFFRSARGKING